MNKELPPPSQNPIPEVVNPAPTLPDGRRRSSRSLARTASKRAAEIRREMGLGSGRDVPSGTEFYRMVDF